MEKQVEDTAFISAANTSPKFYFYRGWPRLSLLFCWLLAALENEQRAPKIIQVGSGWQAVF
jgi:hypothetical protein